MAAAGGPKGGSGGCRTASTPSLAPNLLDRPFTASGLNKGWLQAAPTELMEDDPFETRQAGRTALFGFIEGFYNRARLHSAIGDKAATKTQQLTAAA
jgi:hypothetical protein